MTKIEIRFTQEVDINFAEIQRCFVNKNKFEYKCTLPIIVGTSTDKYHFDFNPLFKTQFEFKIETIVKLEKILKNINFWEVDSFFKKHFPESDFLNKLRIKAKKWISKDIPEPVLFEIDGRPKSEFIKCDSETSFYGNYTLNGIEGCYLNMGERKDFEFNFNFKPYFSMYDLPYQLDLDCGLGNNLIEVVNILKSQNVSDGIIHDFVIKCYKNSVEYMLEEKPFFIKLSGNDDDSWTKYFNTKTEALEEMYRLRRCQPINKWIDVMDNGYVFTN